AIGPRTVRRAAPASAPSASAGPTPTWCWKKPRHGPSPARGGPATRRCCRPARPALDLGDGAYTSQNGRKPLGARRIAVVGRDPAEAAAILERPEPRRVVD